MKFCKYNNFILSEHNLFKELMLLWHIYYVTSLHGNNLNSERGKKRVRSGGVEQTALLRLYSHFVYTAALFTTSDTTPRRNKS